MRQANASADYKPSFALLAFAVGLGAIQVFVFQRAGAAESSADGRISPPQIIAAWRARQERIRSAKVVWVQDCVDKKGSKKRYYDTRVHKTLDEPFPADDTTYSRTHTLQLDGDKWRLDTDGPIWNGERETLMNAKSSGVYVGGITKQYTDAGEALGRNDRPIGKFGHMVRDELGLMIDLMVDDVWPIAWFLRPFTLKEREAFCGSAEALITLPAAEADRMKSDGIVVFGSRLHNALRLWLDVARDYLVVRAEMGAPLQLNVTYMDDAEHGPLPSEWNLVRCNPEGAERCVVTCRVTEWQINCEIPPSTFELQFPPGTEVMDEVHQQPRLRVADDKGELGPRSRIETQDRDGVRRSWLLALNAVVLVCLVAVVVYRYRRKRG